MVKGSYFLEIEEVIFLLKGVITSLDRIVMYAGLSEAPFDNLKQYFLEKEFLGKKFIEPKTQVGKRD